MTAIKERSSSVSKLREKDPKKVEMKSKIIPKSSKHEVVEKKTEISPNRLLKVNS